MTPFTPEAGDDAARDAAALARCAFQGDRAVLGTVAANLSWPQATAAILADWLAATALAGGTSPDDSLSLLAAWQADVGLG